MVAQCVQEGDAGGNRDLQAVDHEWDEIAHRSAGPVGCRMSATLRSRSMRDRLHPLPAAAPSRRQFLAGAAAATLLVACGDDDAASPSGAGGDDQGDGTEPSLSIVRFFGPYFVAGAVNRVPFGLADGDGLLPADRSPDELIVTVTSPDGTVLADAIAAPIRTEGLPRPYYSFEFTPDDAPGSTTSPRRPTRATR